MTMNMCAAGSLIVGGAVVGVKHNFVGSPIGRCPPHPNHPTFGQARDEDDPGPEVPL